MMNSKTTFFNSSGRASKIIVICFLILSFIGFLDASYLAAKHYLGTPINCSLLNGCDTVTTSKFAVLFGIPIALLGAIYYLAVFVLSLMYFDAGRINLFKFAFFMTAGGFIFSLFLVYLQIFVIGALCLYCLISAAISTALFFLGLRTMLKLKEARSDVSFTRN